jgi:hypothetical protein
MSNVYKPDWLPNYYSEIVTSPDYIIDYDKDRMYLGYKAVAIPANYSIWHGSFVTEEAETEKDALEAIRARICS